MIAQSGLTRPAGHNMLFSAGSPLLLLLLLSVDLLGQAGAQAQGVDIEVLSHICKFGVHSDGRRYNSQSVSQSDSQ